MISMVFEKKQFASFGAVLSHADEAGWILVRFSFPMVIHSITVVCVSGVFHG
jgi:hypothetical protein